MHAKEIRILKNDGIGILPTDTLYGVVGSALSKKAVLRVYALKSRNEKKPLIVLIASVNDLKKFGIKLTEEQRNFLDSVWAARLKARRPTSVILPCPLKKFDYLHRGTKSIAFRVPAQKSLQAFLRRSSPLVAPSANPEGLEPAHTIKEAQAYFADKVDFYISGGRKQGLPSTIISLLKSSPEILRK